MNNVKTIEASLAADLAAAGTVNVSYPAGYNENHFAAAGHKFSVMDGGNYVQGRDFAITLTATYATITLAAGMATIPAGSKLFLELRKKGDRERFDTTALGVAGNRLSRREVVEVNLGAPIAADPDGLVTGYTGAAGAIPLNGALVANGVAVFDVPRGIVVDSGGVDTSVITVTGTDEFGAVLVENITTNGTTAVPGKKAFKSVTGISGSLTAANGIFIGTTDVLGLPVFLGNSVDILYDKEDGAAVTDGTYVAGVLTKPTATTGDVRGTYDPNSACDGAKNFSVVMLVEDVEFRGVPQFAG